MAALTQGAAREWARTELTNYGLGANAQVWRGGAVRIESTGFVVALTSGANYVFGGFAWDDAKGAAVAGQESVDVIRAGVVTLNVTGATAATVNKNVYATSDNDFTTSSGSNAVKIGVAIEHVSGTTLKVQFDAFAKQLAA